MKSQSCHPLTLDDGNGSQFDALLANASRMTCVHNIRDILVRLGRLFHDQLRGGHTNGDAQCLHIVQHIGILEVAPGFGTR